VADLLDLQDVTPPVDSGVGSQPSPVTTSATDRAGQRSRSRATFYATVIQGMSTQACDGASRSDLERVVTIAMKAWPG
jgi:hypothetical protein